MNPTQSTFDSQHLTVDYLTLKFPQLPENRQTKIVHYLGKIGFKSSQEFEKLVKPIQEPSFVTPDYFFQVCFVGDNPHWDATLLHFSEHNAAKFYQLAKERKIDWSLFSGGVLSRLDLDYRRVIPEDEKIKVQDFLQRSFEELKQTKRNVSFDQNPQGSILKIGNQRSNLSYRIYLEKSWLKFKHEMKGKFLQKYHSLLVENQFSELENQLSNHFFQSFAKQLPLHSSYLDWLVIQVRSLAFQQVSKNYLMKNTFQSFSDRKDFLGLLQFSKYAQQLEFISDSLGTTHYRQVSFRLEDFFQYLNPDIDSTNDYQMKKLLIFFHKVQKNSLIQIFTDSYFRSLMTIPQVKLEKSKQRKDWIMKVCIAEELFDYLHLFVLPHFSLEKLTKDELEVQFYCIQTFRSIHSQKKFWIQEFFESYSSPLSNERKTKMKQLFLQFVAFLNQEDRIESNYKVIQNGVFHSVDHLTFSNISEGFIIYEKLKI